MLEQPLPDYAANRILEAYVNVLEANDQVSLVFGARWWPS